jgi:hypothetical protein
MTDQLSKPVTWWDVLRTQLAAFTLDFRGFCQWLDRNELTIGHGYKVVRKRRQQ